MRVLLIAGLVATFAVGATALAVRADPQIESGGFAWNFGWFAEKKIDFGLKCARLVGRGLESSFTGPTLVFSRAEWEKIGPQRRAEIVLCRDLTKQLKI